MKNQHIRKNTLYEVLTPSGWSDFDGVVITSNKETIQLNDIKLQCTPDHLIKINEQFVEAQSLPHTKSVTTEVYDLLNVDKENQYYTNEVVSHNCLYIDEAAFLLNDMEFYESTYPTVSSGKESRVIITSTPNGARGLFYKLWTESVENINQFKRMEVPWHKVPGRDLAWKETQIGNTSPEQFAQEHSLIFRGSQNSLLSADTLAMLPIKRPIANHGHLRVYEEPVTPTVEAPGHEYLITVDTSRGLGKDYCAFIVFDITAKPYNVVAVYKNNRISPMVYPQVIRTIADKYNTAYVLVEINDIGEQVANILYYDFEYENVLMCYTEKSYQTIGFIKEPKVGVRTTVQVKSIGCSNVKTMIESGNLILNDEDIIGEFGTFIPKGKSYEADSGANDDLAMCCVLFAWASVQDYFIDMVNRNVKRDVLDSLEDAAMAELLPFGIISDGIEEYAIGMSDLDMFNMSGVMGL